MESGESEWHQGRGRWWCGWEGEVGGVAEWEW